MPHPSRTLELLPTDRELQSPIVANDEAARRLGLSRSSFYEWVRAGAIPHAKVGNRIVITEANLAAMSRPDGATQGPSATEAGRHVLSTQEMALGEGLHVSIILWQERPNRRRAKGA